MADPKRLLLLRHAKSSWDDPGLTDHDRPLSPRGRRAAARIGRHLSDHGVPVTLVLCSSARRARETLERVAPPGAVEIEPRLYGASAAELLARLRRLPEAQAVVMLIGHSPAIEELAAALATGPDPLAGRKFPTGGLATLTWAGTWSDLGPGKAALASFVVPRELG